MGPHTKISRYPTALELFHCANNQTNQVVIELILNAAASQTARDTVAVSRTDFHALLFVNILENTVQIHSKMTRGLMTRKGIMMLLVQKNF